MEDPIQFNLRRRQNDEIMLRPQHGNELPIRAYNVPASPEGEADDFATLMRYVWILWKHKWILLLAVALGTLASLAVVLRSTPIYHAKTTLEILKIPQALGVSAVAESSTDTQSQVLASKMLRRRAANSLPESTNPKQFRIEGPLADLRKVLKLKEPATLIPWEEAVSSASLSLLVTKPKEDSDILVLESDSPNPVAAAAFTDALAQTYIKFAEEQRVSSYQNSSSWMTDELQKLKEKIETSQQQLAQFAREKGLIFTDAADGMSGTQTVGEEKLKQTAADLQNAQSERIKIESASEAAKSKTGETLPAGLNSGALDSIDGQLVAQNSKLANLQTNLTDANPEVKRVLNEIESLKTARQNEVARLENKSKIESAAAKNREAQLTSDFKALSTEIGRQSDDLITYNIKRREIETNTKLYASMLEEGKSASIASAMRNSSARIVDSATVPRSPIQPNLPFTLSLGILGGFCCGAGLVIVRSRLNQTIKDPGVLEVELNVRELGVIPSARTDIQARNLRAFSNQDAGSKRLRAVDCLEMVAHSETPSVMAEAFRSTMTSLLFSSENGDQPRVIVFTSAAPGEGKSTVVSNLAISLAQTNQRVLLVDADMRLPRAHAIFDVPNNFGLSDVLHERKPVEDYIEESLVRKTRVPNLYLLPAGPARTNMSRLIHSGRMKELMTRLRDSFDIILIDTAPVLIVPDSRIFARAADAVVLVVRANHTHQKAAFAAANCFASDGTRILGTILNDWNPGMSSQVYGGYYGSSSYTGYFPDK